MPVNQDLKLAIENIKVKHSLTQGEIAKKLGNNNAYLSGVINGHTPFSEKLRNKIYEVFHIYIEISETETETETENQEYTGLGNKNIPIRVIDTEEKYINAIKFGLKMLPEVDFTFSAGRAELIANTNAITRYWYLPDCEDCEAVVSMTGTSMLPAYPPGCELILKRYGFDIRKPNTIAFGNTFGIVLEDPITGQWFGHIKIIRRHKEPDMANNYWIAHSLNTAEFDDFDIEISQVRGLWVVKQHVVTNILL